jgi:hypothetical protein
MEMMSEGRMFIENTAVQFVIGMAVASSEERM